MIAHQRFEAWRCAHRLALEVYDATDRWPRSEMYGLTSQARRAAISIPANIAEGAARHGPPAVCSLPQHIRWARWQSSSYSASSSAAIVALCDEAEWRALESLRDQTGKLVYGLYRRVRRVGPTPPVLGV